MVMRNGVFIYLNLKGEKKIELKTSIVFFTCFRNLQGETFNSPMDQIHESFCSSNPKIILFLDCELGRTNFSKLLLN